MLCWVTSGHTVRLMCPVNELFTCWHIACLYRMWDGSASFIREAKTTVPEVITVTWTIVTAWTKSRAVFPYNDVIDILKCLKPQQMTFKNQAVSQRVFKINLSSLSGVRTDITSSFSVPCSTPGFPHLNIYVSVGESRLRNFTTYFLFKSSTLP